MVVDNGFKLLAKRKIEDENDPTGDSYSVLESSSSDETSDFGVQF